MAPGSSKSGSNAAYEKAPVKVPMKHGKRDEDLSDEAPIDDFMELVQQTVAFHMKQYVKQIFTSCNDLLRKKQFATSPRAIQDKLITVQSLYSTGISLGNWLFKNKEHGKASEAASLGMVLLWDVDSGLPQLDK